MNFWRIPLRLLSDQQRRRRAGHSQLMMKVWQSYDWSGIASLGAPAPEEVEAHAAWASTNWDSSTGRSRGLPPYEVAAALDEIARRIRSGELSLAQFQGTPPEAAIAAVFAALLRTKG